MLQSSMDRVFQVSATAAVPWSEGSSSWVSQQDGTLSFLLVHAVWSGTWKVVVLGCCQQQEAGEFAF